MSRVARSLLVLLALSFLLPTGQATHDPNDFWVIESSGTTFDLGWVHGISPTNIVATGISPVSNGVLLERGVAGTWTTRTCGGGSSINRGAFVQNGAAYIAKPAVENQICRRAGGPGSTWSIEAIPTSVAEGIQLNQLHGVANTNGAVFGVGHSQPFAGANPSFIQRHSGTWSQSLMGAAVPLTCGDTPPSLQTTPVVKTGSFYRDVYHVQPNATYLLCQGWLLGQPTGSSTLIRKTDLNNTNGQNVFTATNRMEAIWASSWDRAFAVGFGGAIWHTTDGGVSWSQQTSPTGQSLFDVYGTSETNVWAVGAGGTIIHWDGTVWTTEPSPTTAQLNGIWWFSATQGWIVGNGGVILSFQSNPAVALPSLAGLQLDRDDLNVAASQAQCNGDEVDLRVETDVTIGAGGVDVFVIDSESNIVIESFANVETAPAPWFDLNDRLQHTSRTYPPGEYVLLATVDAQGALTPDLFSTWPFSVPLGTCIDSFRPFDPAELEALLNEILLSGNNTGGFTPVRFTGFSEGDSNVLLFFVIFLVFSLAWGLLFPALACTIGIVGVFVGGVSDTDLAWAFVPACLLMVLAFWVESISGPRTWWRLNRKTDARARDSE